MWLERQNTHMATCRNKQTQESADSTQAHTNMLNAPSLFTLGTFSCGSTLIICWYSAVIARLAPGGGREAPHLKKRKRNRWYLPGWCVWPVQHTNKSDTSLSGETSKKRKEKKKDEDGGLSVTPWHPVPTFNLSKSYLCSSNPWKQTSIIAWWNILSRIAP